MVTKSLDAQFLQYLPQLEKEEKKALLVLMKSFLKHRLSEEPIDSTEKNSKKPKN